MGTHGDVSFDVFFFKKKKKEKKKGTNVDTLVCSYFPGNFFSVISPLPFIRYQNRVLQGSLFLTF